MSVNLVEFPLHVIVHLSTTLTSTWTHPFIDLTVNGPPKVLNCKRSNILYLWGGVLSECHIVYIKNIHLQSNIFPLKKSIHPSFAYLSISLQYLKLPSIPPFNASTYLATKILCFPSITFTELSIDPCNRPPNPHAFIYTTTCVHSSNNPSKNRILSSLKQD